MLGPVLVIVAAVTIGALTEGTAGAVGAGLAGLGAVAAVAAGAAVWARGIGRLVEPAEAWRQAPRPPLFGRLCEAVYRRVLPPPGEGLDRDEGPGYAAPRN